MQGFPQMTRAIKGFFRVVLKSRGLRVISTYEKSGGKYEIFLSEK